MDGWEVALSAGSPALLAALAAVGVERLALAALRAMLLSRQALAGEEGDTHVYHRNPWALDRPGAFAILGSLAASGILAFMALEKGPAAALAALLLWLAGLGWDLWTWERVACSVNAVVWRRGWRKPLRRVPITDLRGVRVTRGHAWGRHVPQWLQPASCRLVLELRNGMAVELPRTGDLLGVWRPVQRMVNFLRLQIEESARERRLKAGERRAAGRQDRQGRPDPLHHAARVPMTGLPISVLR